MRVDTQEQFNLDIHGRVATVEGTVKTHGHILETLTVEIKGLTKELRSAKTSLWVIAFGLLLHESGFSLGALFSFAKVLIGVF